MILRNGDFKTLAGHIKHTNQKIIVYGAGMIGQIIVPYLVNEYDLKQNLDCFVDADIRKAGQKIMIGTYFFEIRRPEYLHQHLENTILLITNSKFLPIVRFLDHIETLNRVEGYIVPMMQIYELQMMRSITIRKKTDNPLIPKTIHYCWFGGKVLPDFLQKCIASWKTYCPDYKIICWNESNYDVNKHTYTKEAYEQKKYGFVSDMARLDILYEHGGIYFDTDVTLLKNIDDLLYQEGFIGVEKWGNINSGGGCGFIAGHPIVKEMIDYRDQYHFVLNDGSFNIETNGMYETIPFLLEGFKPNSTLQVIKGVTIYPFYVLNPYDYMSCELQKKEATVSIHHFYGGWMEEEDRQYRKNTQEEYTGINKRIEKGYLNF